MGLGELQAVQTRLSRPSRSVLAEEETGKVEYLFRSSRVTAALVRLGGHQGSPSKILTSRLPEYL